MKYFDLLFYVYAEGETDPSHYQVKTVRSLDDRRAREYGRKLAAAKFWTTHCGFCRRTLIGVGKAGDYDAFIGKYFGQFIDEATDYGKKPVSGPRTRPHWGG